MAKPLTPEQISEFRQFCQATLAEDDSGYFTLESYPPFAAEDGDGGSLWEFHASNYDPPRTHDIYELFGSLLEFAVEVHGHDEFYVVPRAA